MATELQVQQQRNALATFEATVPALQQQLEIAQHALAVLTGNTPEQLTVQLVALGDIPISQPRSDLPARLLETQPDIRAKEALMHSANFDVGAAHALSGRRHAGTGAARALAGIGEPVPRVWRRHRNGRHIRQHIT